jgi:hypothetical protein
VGIATLALDSVLYALAGSLLFAAMLKLALKRGMLSHY